jgi:hypothetical protein
MLERGAGSAVAGIRIKGTRHEETGRLRAMVGHLGLEQHVVVVEDDLGTIGVLRDEVADAWVPHGDTTGLAQVAGLDPATDADDLEREILLAMFAAPRRIELPSFDELAASVRIRRNVAAAARRTQLAFHTSEAERPAEYWIYAEERGFTLLPGVSLIDALVSATQPDVSGTVYCFSCYRATEYVILLGIAQELQAVNPALLAQLESHWQATPIMSAAFHDVFLNEFGSLDDPLPLGYYVPGDRVWFRNPDDRSSDVPGFEGSWVIYLGGGLFANFWNRDQPYTLWTKCVEIFHWRDGVFTDDNGELRMDESLVEQRMRASLANVEARERIVARMARLRDPRGIYAEGGCIDASREFPRPVCPATASIVLPGH